MMTVNTEPIIYSICPRLLRIKDSSQVGEARRLACSLWSKLSNDELRLAQVALIATELATNLIKHTNGAGGCLILCPVYETAALGMDILAIDQGPGIANMAEALRGGYSTTGSSGVGLGAVGRLSSVFDIFSGAGKGTGVLSRVLVPWPSEIPPALNVGTVCLPIDGEAECGDAWAVKQATSSTLLLLADGLGHGPNAAEAANLAVTIFKNAALASPLELLRQIHSGLGKTRGAAVAVADICFATQVISYAALGNIVGRIFCGAKSQTMVGCNGTAGFEARNIVEFCYPWPEGGRVVLHSDGLKTHWHLDDYPGLAQRHPALIAGVLFRDHRRPHDDCLVVVAK